MVVDFLVSEYLLTLICFTQNKFKGRNGEACCGTALAVN